MSRAAHPLLTAAILTSATLLLLSSPAAADNHFILELEGGIATPMGIDAETEVGRAFAGTFGFGGRIPGFAPAYYAVGRVGHSRFGFTGPRSLGAAEVERDQLDWAVGGRMYLPLTQRLRVLAQVALGETYDEALVQRSGHRDLLVQSDTFAVFTEAGLQYRFTDHFSLGAVADLAWLPDHEEQDLAARTAGVDDGGDFGRARFALTTTLHF